MQAIRTALGQYIYTAEDVDAELAKKNARIAELENGIRRLGSNEAFLASRALDPERDDELIARMKYANDFLMETGSHD